MQEEKSDFIQIDNHQLHYVKYGEGSKAILAFHGYGQDQASWLPLIELWKKEYTIYSFDLFFHGKSKWNSGDAPLSKETWKEFINAFIKKEQIETFTLAGYSMGGKFALATLEIMPERIKEVYLLAPDGIKTTFWYSMATYPIAIRKIFRMIVVKPLPFFGILIFFNKTRIIDRGIIKFAALQMTTQTQRGRVYFSWVVFRKLAFDLKKLASLINKHQINVKIFLGKYDKIIQKESFNAFTNLVNQHERNIINSRHSNLIEGVAKLLNHQLIKK